MWFLMQERVVFSRHFSREKARKAARLSAARCTRLGLRPFRWTLARLSSPGYWKRGDNPNPSYFLEVESA
jgi:hypothetical protein